MIVLADHARRFLFAVGHTFAKTAGAVPAYNLAGTLYRSQSGWLLLSVPNAFVRGVFAAMREPGAELPPGHNGGPMEAHVSVMRPEELARIDGGADAVTERGKQFHYSLGRLAEVRPRGWPEMEKAWVVEVRSPELKALRRSYGLSGLPHNDQFAFHVTVAVKRRAVTTDADVVKGG